VKKESKYNCKDQGLPLCFACLEQAECQIIFFRDMLDCYSSDGSDDKEAKEYIKRVLIDDESSVLGKTNAIYLKKAIEIFYLKYLDVFDKLATML
jgi:hypothetical protein